jgi:multidrug resistance efflux pump
MPQNEDTTFVRAKLRSHPKMRWRRIVNRWPFYVWLAVVALAMYFYLKSTQYGTLAGSVQDIHHDISPLQTARLKEICVKIGESVTNGQIVAEMDTTLVDAQVAEAEATLSAAQGSWAAYDAQMLNLVRAVEDDISSAQALINQQKEQRDSDVAKLAELKKMQSNRDQLFKNKLISEVEADALRPEIAGLEKTVAADTPLLAMYAQTLERRRKDREVLRQSLRLAPNEDVTKAIALKTEAQAEILKKAVDMRKLEKSTYSLRSTTNGVVSEISVFPGTIATPGVSVVRIVSRNSQIIGYLPEMRRGLLKVGDRGYAFRLRQPPVKVRVVAVAPEIEPVPLGVRPITAAQQSGVTFRAQRIVFETEGLSDLTAGESVQIRLTSQWWAKVRYWLALQW